MRSTKRLNLAHLAALGSAAVLALSAAAMADPYMNINFSGDSDGSPPATTSSNSLPLTQPNAIGGYDDATTNPYGDSPPKADEGTVIVNPAGTMSKSMVMTSYTPNDQAGAIWVDTDYSISAQQMSLAFDLDILQTTPSASTASQTWGLNSPTGPTIGTVLGINQFTSAGTIFDFGAAPTSSTGGYLGLRNPNLTEFDSFFNYTVGTTYHVELDANFASDTVDMYVDNSLVAANYPMRAGLASNDLTETFFYLNGDTSYSNEVAIGNIQASVPEPASFSLAGAGALALLKRRRGPAKQ